jgi:hypothetical protein
MIPVAAQDQGGGQPVPGAAAEVTAANRALKKSYFKTANGLFLPPTTAWANAFSDTVANCPGTSGTCTIAVTVSSQFGSVAAGAVARARVLIDGAVAPPGDACCLNMSTNPNGAPSVHAMTFVSTGRPFGNRLVQVQFSTSSGTAYADFRTLEIRVYKP